MKPLPHPPQSETKLLIEKCSLGWMEMRTTLAKLHFKYDLELMDTHVD